MDKPLDEQRNPIPPLWDPTASPSHLQSSRSQLDRSEPPGMLDLGTGIARHCVQTMVLCWVTASPPNPAVSDSMRKDLQVRFAGIWEWKERGD